MPFEAMEQEGGVLYYHARVGDSDTHIAPDHHLIRYTAVKNIGVNGLESSRRRNAVLPDYCLIQSMLFFISAGK